MKNFKWDNRYLYAGITALLVIFCCIVFFMFFQHWGAIKSSIIDFMGIISPFVWGFVIAYLLRPMMSFFQRKLFTPLTEKIFKTEVIRFRIARVLSIFLSIIVAWFIIVTLLWLIIPRFYESIESLVLMLPEYFNSVNKFILNKLTNFPQFEVEIRTIINQIYDNLTDWLTNDLQPQMKDIVELVSSSLKAVLLMVINILIGFIVSCYLLYNKEKFSAQFKKILYSILAIKHVETVLSCLRFIDRVFIGFLGGKLLDSAIIGVLCYIGCSMLKMPYTTLISVIVGVTNIIPYFGPFIGAVPCTFIILIASPTKGLIFILFILALQQFDGNILGPRILGNSVGISGFWVMFSIIVGGGLFGFTGMLIGVPVFVVLSTGFNRLIEDLLKKRGLPTETAKYSNPENFSTENSIHKKKAD